MFNMDLLKLSELLKPKRSPTDPYGNSQAYPEMMGSLNDDLLSDNSLNPRDEQYEQFVQLLGLMPKRENFEPSKGRRFAAFMAGLGAGGPVGISSGAPIGYRSDVGKGLEVQRAINDEPYDKAMYDWNSQAKPLLEASKLENTKNVNTRIASSNVRTAELREQGLKRQLMSEEEKARHNKEEEDRKREELKIRQQRAATYDYRTKNPNHVYQTDKDGFVYSVNPQTDKITYLTDDDGDKIQSSKLSDRDRIEMQLDATLEEIRARGSVSRSLEEQRQGNREKLLGQREKNIRTRPTRATSSRNETPYEKAVKAVNTHPEWKDYILFDDVHKTFRVDIPKAKTKGILGLGKEAPAGDPKVAQEINDFIYGDSKSSSSSTKVTKPTIRAKDGKTHVRKKSTGEEGWVTDPDLDKYDLIP